MISKVYDQIVFGHWNYLNIFSFLAYSYYWPKIKDIIYYYIQNCYICRYIKAFRDQYKSLSKLISISISF